MVYLVWPLAWCVCVCVFVCVFLYVCVWVWCVCVTMCSCVSVCEGVGVCVPVCMYVLVCLYNISLIIPTPDVWAYCLISKVSSFEFRVYQFRAIRLNNVQTPRYFHLMIATENADPDLPYLPVPTTAHSAPPPSPTSHHGRR